MTDMKEIILDVSELPAPEPFEKIMQAVAGLAENEYLRVAHRRQPLLLYKPLQENGFDFHVQKADATAFDIFIWQQRQSPPSGLSMPSIAETDNPPDQCCED